MLCEDWQDEPGLLASWDLILAVKVAVLRQHLNMHFVTVEQMRVAYTTSTGYLHRSGHQLSLNQNVCLGLYAIPPTVYSKAKHNPKFSFTPAYIRNGPDVDAKFKVKHLNKAVLKVCHVSSSSERFVIPQKRDDGWCNGGTWMIDFGDNSQRHRQVVGQPFKAAAEGLCVL